MKQLPFHLLITFFSLLIAVSSSCQSNSTEGVYAGVRLGLAVNGGMTRHDETLLLRKNNTFTEDLEKSDWQTKVDGTYTKSGSKIILKYSKGKTLEYELTADGNLGRKGYYLSKMTIADRIPAGNYIFKSASSSGGIGTGSDYIGTNAKHSLYFDGKGNFSDERESTTAIIGDHIGGGANSNDQNKGKYELKNGVLTLKYQTGKSTIHSFFANQDSKGKVSAIVDGRFFFLEDIKSDNNKSAPNKKVAQTAPLPKASDLLEQLRKNYGGSAIDQLKTCYSEATLGKLKMRSYADLENQHYRSEIYQDQKLMAVEQIKGTTSWQWINGTTKAVTAQRLKEVKYGIYTGITALKQDYQNVLSSAKVEATSKGYRLFFEKDGCQFGMELDEKYNIISEAYQIGNNKTAINYSDLRNVDGLKLAFASTTINGKNKLTLNYDKYIINKPLPTDWGTPKR